MLQQQRTLTKGNFSLLGSTSVWCPAPGHAIKGTVGSQRGTEQLRSAYVTVAHGGSMERPIFKPVGTPVAQLDTPALVVDLALVEHNIAALHTFFQQREA